MRDVDEGLSVKTGHGNGHITCHLCAIAKLSVVVCAPTFCGTIFHNHASRQPRGKLDDCFVGSGTVKAEDLCWSPYLVIGSCAIAELPLIVGSPTSG